MKSYSELFLDTDRTATLGEREIPLSVLLSEYEGEVISALFPEVLYSGLSKMNLSEQLSCVGLLVSEFDSLAGKSALSSDYPTLSVEKIKSEWHRCRPLYALAEIIDALLVTEGGVLVGVYAYGKILWLGCEIDYKTTRYSSGDNNGAGYKGEGYYEASAYLSFLYSPSLIFTDTIFASGMNMDITELVVAEGITTLAPRAFEGRKSLTRARFSKSLREIGSGAFAGCSSLESIEIPEGITSIGSRAFLGCASLRTVRIPASVTKLGWEAFSGCSSLESVEIVGETEIDSSAFKGCEALGEVVFERRGATVGSFAFSECKRLLAIVGSENIVKIGEYAFFGCESLTEFKVADGIYSILGGTFGGCSSLERIYLPESVKSIGSYALSSCSSLVEISLSSELWSISSGAFFGCSSLTRVSLPEEMVDELEKSFEGELPEEIEYIFI